MKICSCGNYNPDENRFCTVCGKSLEEMPQQQNNVAQGDFINNANENGNNVNPDAYNTPNGYNQNNGNYNNGCNAGYTPNAQNTGYNPNGYNSNGYNPNAYTAPNNGYNPQGNQTYGYGSSPFAQPMMSPGVRQYKEGLAKVFASAFTLVTGILITVAAGISLISDGGLIMNLLLIVGISLLVLNSKAKKSFPNFKGVFTAIKTYNILNIVFVSLVIFVMLVLLIAFASIPWDEVMKALENDKSTGVTSETLQVVLDFIIMTILSVLPFMVSVMVNCAVGIKAMTNLKTSYDAGYKTTKKLTAYAVTCFIVAITSVIYSIIITSGIADMVNAMIELAKAMDSYSGEISVTLSGLPFASICYAVAFVFYGIWLLKIKSFNSNFVVRKEEPSNNGNFTDNGEKALA